MKNIIRGIICNILSNAKETSNSKFIILKKIGIYVEDAYENKMNNVLKSIPQHRKEKRKI